MMTNDIEKILGDGGFETVRLDRARMTDGPVWDCKIGLKKGTHVVLPGGCDLPMREAIEAEFQRITGHDCDFNFSGWGAELDIVQQRIVEESDATVYEIANEMAKNARKWGPEVVAMLKEFLRDD